MDTIWPCSTGSRNMHNFSDIIDTFDNNPNISWPFTTEANPCTLFATALSCIPALVPVSTSFCEPFPVLSMNDEILLKSLQDLCPEFSSPEICSGLKVLNIIYLFFKKYLDFSCKNVHI